MFKKIFSWTIIGEIGLFCVYWDYAEWKNFSEVDNNFFIFQISNDPLVFANNSFSKIWYIKGSRQRERRGFGKVSNIRNMPRTAAIEVLFSFNFAVVFDFMYFHLRPSKAKWIGNVLTNRRNAAIRSMFFFSFILRFAYWRTESVCVIRQSSVNRKKSPRKTTWKL